MARAASQKAFGLRFEALLAWQGLVHEAFVFDPEGSENY